MFSPWRSTASKCLVTNTLPKRFASFPDGKLARSVHTWGFHVGLDGAQTLPTWLWLVFSFPAFLTSELFFSSSLTLPVMRGELGMFAPTCNPRPWKVKAARWLWLQDQPGLHSPFQAGWKYSVRLCLKTKQKSKQAPKHKYLSGLNVKEAHPSQSWVKRMRGLQKEKGQRSSCVLRHRYAGSLLKSIANRKSTESLQTYPCCCSHRERGLRQKAEETWVSKRRKGRCHRSLILEHWNLPQSTEAVGKGWGVIEALQGPKEKFCNQTKGDSTRNCWESGGLFPPEAIRSLQVSSKSA